MLTVGAVATSAYDDVTRNRAGRYIAERIRELEQQLRRKKLAA